MLLVVICAPCEYVSVTGSLTKEYGLQSLADFGGVFSIFLYRNVNRINIINAHLNLMIDVQPLLESIPEVL